MKDGIAIDISHVTKRFALNSGRGTSLKHLVVDAFRRRRDGASGDVFTALSDVCLEVRKGETLGIIGRNGAGKSTLLSIIAGTIAPTEGHVEADGKISSLLELGAGFHPDLTGRENVFLYGAIMGVPKAEMRRRFDDIVDFAGIGQFIDQPVRFYSSGMYVRLGFSVAVQIDPDILLVDEVLAVGDTDFQKRCLTRMHEFRKSGKTLILISHDLGTIMSISDRIAILDHGKIVNVGGPVDMVDSYGARIAGERIGNVQTTEWGSREATITHVAMLGPDGAPTNRLPADRIIRLAVDFASTRRIESPVFGFGISRDDDLKVFGSNTKLEGFAIPAIDEKGGRAIFEIDAATLQSGTYRVSFSLHSDDYQTDYHRLDNALAFCIENAPRNFDGVATLPVKCGIEAGGAK